MKSKEYITLKKKIDFNMFAINQMLLAISSHFCIEDEYVVQTLRELDNYICDNYILIFPERPDVDVSCYNIEKEEYEITYFLSKPIKDTK